MRVRGKRRRRATDGCFVLFGTGWAWRRNKLGEGKRMKQRQRYQSGAEQCHCMNAGYASSARLSSARLVLIKAHEAVAIRSFLLVPFYDATGSLLPFVQLHVVALMNY